MIYYNQQKVGLGFEFAFEIQKTLNLIEKYPDAWSPFSANTRKCNCNRFPYIVIYHHQENSITILAIMHSKRKPDYWKNRIENN